MYYFQLSRIKYFLHKKLLLIRASVAEAARQKHLLSFSQFSIGLKGVFKNRYIVLKIKSNHGF